jgi:methionyl-tRNA synthetase
MSDETAPADPAADAPESAASDRPPTITYDDFAKLELRVAEVVGAEPHPNADKLLKLTIRVGERTKQICAGIRAHYDPAALLGRRIVIVDNLAPRKLRGEVSEGMLLAASVGEELSLLTTDRPDMPSGAEIH